MTTKQELEKALEDKYKSLIDLSASVFAFMKNEMAWEFFREEMFSDTASGKNAKKVQEYVKEFAASNPEVWKDIEPIMLKILK